MPAWVTVNVWSPIVSVAVRAMALVFAVAAKFTVPGPEPPPEVTVSHAALLVAVQEQPPEDSTPTEPVAADAVSAWLVADRVVLQAGADGAICNRVMGCPATVRVAVRVVLVALAARLMLTVPAPLPGDPAVTDSHVASLDAVHGQTPGVDTASDPVPPDAASCCIVASSFIEYPFAP